ncbi:hypothetical protein JD844_018446 [Phrynosoma platyrhinos]|uniref:Sushi domain-containing protein n=1 Tax=Phrynosoma platyrhinos TaxID=52577 RepID=A0ABQ7SNG5_PHRPL|nr:hypothetical protein JD844_018446 [Phrynosoma platyrhinos]
MSAAYILSLLWGSATVLAITLEDQGHGCFPPARLHFAELADEYKEKNSFPVGSTVKYICRPGYTRNQQKTSRTCLQNQRWSEVEEFCRKRSCGHPGEPDNGRLHVSGDFLFGATVNFTCDEGHRLIGHSSRRCVIFGKKVEWTGAVPFCEQMVSTFREQLLTTDRTAPASSPILTNELLASVHSLKVNYEKSGGSCGPPLRLAFADVTDEYKNNNSFPVGTTVKYICRPGYFKHPGLKASLTCIQNQEWSEVQEFCKRKSCGNPGEPENGRLLVSGDFLFGSTINYSCEEGYKLVGESSRQCLVVSERKVAWTGSVALCQSISCLPPPDIPHGRHSGRYLDNFFYGTAITYTCDKGYPLVGNASIFCTTKDGSNGVWSGRAYCGVINCPSPQIENGKVETGYSITYIYNQRVTLSCNAGHRLAGSREIYCQVDGTWDPTLPHCEWEVQCLPPPNIQNGSYTNLEVASFTSGISVRYACEPGYTLIGKEVIYCTDSGRWNPPAPHCEGCLTPPEIANGKHDKDTGVLKDFPYGSSVTYHCDPDYFLSGPAKIHCLSSGMWEQPIPQCKSRQGTGCITPEINNGRIARLSDVDGPMELITFECDVGYILKGNHTIHCQSDSTWDSPVPSCVRVVQCPQPPYVQNGAHSSQGTAIFTSGISVKYSCEPGYTLTGEATINCTDSGTWTFPAPRCEGCLAPPKIANGKCDTEILGGDFPYGSLVTYHCDPGYFLTGPATMHCLSSGTWDQPVPQCKSRQFSSCVSPKIENGRIARSKAEENSTGTITIECNHGYILKGSHTIRCTSDRTWDSPVPICVKVQCQQPPHVQNGIHNKQEVFTSGMSVEYTCNPGYILIGEATIYCTDSGTWSFPIPHCKEIRCQQPPNIQNGTYSNLEAEAFTSGMSVRYTCEAGYSLIGEATIYCMESGSWSPPAPHCEGCLTPPEIANGKYHNDSGILKDFPYGSSVTYHCDPGYFLIGAGTIYCLSSGLWDHHVPQCKVIQSVGCTLPEISGGRKINAETVIEVGDNVTFDCEEGYILNGSPHVQCQHGSMWDPPVPVCKSGISKHQQELVGFITLLTHCIDLPYPVQYMAD